MEAKNGDTSDGPWPKAATVEIGISRTEENGDSQTTRIPNDEVAVSTASNDMTPTDGEPEDKITVPAVENMDAGAPEPLSSDSSKDANEKAAEKDETIVSSTHTSSTTDNDGSSSGNGSEESSLKSGSDESGAFSDSGEDRVATDDESTAEFSSITEEMVIVFTDEIQRQTDQGEQLDEAQSVEKQQESTLQDRPNCESVQTGEYKVNVRELMKKFNGLDQQKESITRKVLPVRHASTKVEPTAPTAQQPQQSKSLNDRTLDKPVELDTSGRKGVEEPSSEETLASSTNTDDSVDRRGHTVQTMEQIFAESPVGLRTKQVPGTLTEEEDNSESSAVSESRVSSNKDSANVTRKQALLALKGKAGNKSVSLKKTHRKKRKKSKIHEAGVSRMSLPTIPEAISSINSQEEGIVDGDAVDNRDVNEKLLQSTILEDGDEVAKDTDGQPIRSKKRPAEDIRMNKGKRMMISSKKYLAKGKKNQGRPAIQVTGQGVRKKAKDLVDRIDSVTSTDLSRLERGESDPEVTQTGREKVVRVVSTHSRRRSRISNRRIWLLPCILAILLALVAAALSLLVMGYFELGTRNNGKSEDIHPIEDFQRMEDIEAFLVTNQISTSMSLGTSYSESPQARAAAWLAWEDPLRLDIPPYGTSDEDAYPFLSRYVLALLYFSTDGAKWNSPFGFLSERPVCQWQDVIISDSGEPTLYGVICEDEGMISDIILTHNNLEGELPGELVRLTTLRTLQFGSNHKIRGSLPPRLDRLERLTHLAVPRNQMTGALPEELCAILTLQELFLGFNEFDGAIPECIGELANLETLFLSNNLLTGTIPDSMADLEKSKLIWLDDNLLFGNITTTFNGMPLLEALFLEDNAFEGTIDDSFLRGSRGLIQLDISDNRLQGSLPSHFMNSREFGNLQVMDLHGNSLIGNLPVVDTVNDNLQLVALHNNAIQGSFPSSWSNLQGLFHLDLTSNQIEGTLPDAVSYLHDLKYLFLGKNKWTPGPIPASWVTLSKLKELSLKSSHREGSLPVFLEAYRDLVFLDLDDNQFTGGLPKTLGDFNNLEFLLLSRNRFNGPLPLELSQLTSLRAAFLEGNRFTGSAAPLCELPGFQTGTEWSLLVADCSGSYFPTVLQCECCSFCCTAASPVVPNGAGETQITDEGANEESRATCHDGYDVANLNPRWESVYSRKSYVFGGDVWFDAKRSA